MVCRLQRPGTFAGFIETGHHISEDERHKYQKALQSGDFGGEMLERPRPITVEPMEPMEPGHRFTCHLCSDELLGHRFHCAHCYIETQGK